MGGNTQHIHFVVYSIESPKGTLKGILKGTLKGTFEGVLRVIHVVVSYFTGLLNEGPSQRRPSQGLAMKSRYNLNNPRAIQTLYPIPPGLVRIWQTITKPVLVNPERTLERN